MSRSCKSPVRKKCGRRRASFESTRKRGKSLCSRTAPTGSTPHSCGSWLPSTGMSRYGNFWCNLFLSYLEQTLFYILVELIFFKATNDSHPSKFRDFRVLTSRTKPVTVESSIYADFMVCQGSKRTRRLDEGYGEGSAQGIFKRKVAELMNGIPLKVRILCYILISFNMHVLIIVATRPHP